MILTHKKDRHDRMAVLFGSKALSLLQALGLYFFILFEIEGDLPHVAEGAVALSAVDADLGIYDELIRLLVNGLDGAVGGAGAALYAAFFYNSWHVLYLAFTRAVLDHGPDGISDRGPRQPQGGLVAVAQLHVIKGVEGVRGLEALPEPRFYLIRHGLPAVG